VFVPLNELRVLTVHLEPHPPELTITDGYPNDVTPAAAVEALHPHSGRGDDGPPTARPGTATGR
jgi:hypothetical protein